MKNQKTFRGIITKLELFSMYKIYGISKSDIISIIKMSTGGYFYVFLKNNGEYKSYNISFDELNDFKQVSGSKRCG